MRTTHAIAIATGLALATLSFGCSDSSSDDASSEDGVKGDYADAGKDLGRATHVVADVEGEAAFVVYDRGLERRSANGTIESLGKIDGGFEHLVVSKKLVAFLTASFTQGMGTRAVVHVLSRAESWKEVRTEELSTKDWSYQHAIAFVDDDTLAVGSGDKVVLLGAGGSTTNLGGYNTKFRDDEVAAIYPADSSHFYAALDNGEVYDVDTKTNGLTLQPELEGDGGHVLERLFDRSAKTWIVTDFEGIKIFGLDGKLARRADLASKKDRYITAAVITGGKLLVSHQSEANQERSVLATYDLQSLERREVGLFDGMIDQLGPSGKQLFFAFSPRGASGFNSRVWYARSRKL